MPRKAAKKDGSRRRKVLPSKKTIEAAIRIVSAAGYVVQPVKAVELETKEIMFLSGARCPRDGGLVYRFDEETVICNTCHWKTDIYEAQKAYDLKYGEDTRVTSEDLQRVFPGPLPEETPFSHKYDAPVTKKDAYSKVHV